MTNQDFHKDQSQHTATNGEATAEQVRVGVGAPTATEQKAGLVSELRQVSPALARLAQSNSQLSPEEWDQFADALAREINISTPPRRQRLKDRFSTSENRFVRWLAVLVPAVR